ncbi:MAG: hypothetical protein IJ616_00130 [Bacteroidales bacterium]|nr:hypothetical protein [Bacteroidales bacterium]
MKRYPALFLLLCLFLAPACRERRQTVRLLDGIQGYAQAHPDSARAALENISPALLSTPSLRARHALMLSTAQDRIGLNVKQDSCINVAVDYYKRYGSRQDCFLSYYYQGRVYENARDHEAALNSYLLAESFITNKTPDTYLSSLYNHISAIYQNAFDFPRALTSIQKAEEHARKAGLTDFSHSLQIHTGRILLLEGYPEKTDSCLASLKGAKVSPIISAHLTALILLRKSFHQKSNPQIVEALDSLIASHQNQSILPWSTITQVYIRNGASKKALDCLDLYAEQKDSTSNTRYYVLKSEILDSLGDYHNSLEAYKRYIDLSDNEDLKRFGQDTRFLEERLARQRRESRQVILITLLIILVLSSIVVVFYYSRKIVQLRKRYAIEYDYLTTEHQELQSLYNTLTGNAVDKATREALSKRIHAIGVFISQEKPDSLDRVADQLDSLTENRKQLLETIGLLYAIYYPEFTTCLINKNLSITEIGFCSLLVLGFRTGELGEIINRSGFYNISSAIRKKIGLGPNDTNLSIWLKQTYQKTGA